MKKLFITILLLQSMFVFANDNKELVYYQNGALWGFVRDDNDKPDKTAVLLKCNYFSVPDVLIMGSDGPHSLPFGKQDFLSMPQEKLTNIFEKYFSDNDSCKLSGWSINLGIFNQYRNQYIYWNTSGSDAGLIMFRGDEMVIAYESGKLDSIPLSLNNKMLDELNREVIKYDMAVGHASYYKAITFDRGSESTGRILLKNFERELLNKKIRETIVKFHGYDKEQANNYAKIKTILLNTNLLKGDTTKISYVAKNDLGDVVRCYFPSTYSKDGERQVYDYDSGKLIAEKRDDVKNVFIKPILVFSFAGKSDSYFLSKRNYVAHYYNDSFIPTIEATEYMGTFTYGSNELLWEPYAFKWYNGEPKYMVRQENPPWLKWVISENGIDEYKKEGYDWVWVGRYCIEQTEPDKG